jgi:hypothetical protein
MRKTTFAAFLSVLLSVGLGACSGDVFYRTDLTLDPCIPECNRRSALEDRSYRTHGGEAEGRYLVGYVEFDDQGWLHHPPQMDALWNELTRRAADPARQFLVVVYTHGWFHNAAPDDENVGKFHTLLERLDLSERAASEAQPGRTRREVVGVYLGWRGETLQMPLLQHALTFWSRMGAAERVGEGSLKQVLMELAQFKCIANRDADNRAFDALLDRLIREARDDRTREDIRRMKARFRPCEDTLHGPEQTQLVVIGHSFGGLAVEHALRTELMERMVRRGRNADGRYPYTIARGFADLVLLVNPALEGSAFEPLWRAAQSRCFSRSQRPVMMVVTSKGDWATKLAFPAGRLYTLTQSADQPGERAAVMATVGHLDRYRTHDLTYDGGTPPALVPTSELDYREFHDQAADLRPRSILGTTEKASYGDATLTPWPNDEREKAGQEKVVDHNPLVVAQAGTSIIADHGDIWNERFVDFMRRFVVAELNRPKKEFEDPPCSVF